MICSCAEVDEPHDVHLLSEVIKGQAVCMTSVSVSKVLNTGKQKFIHARDILGADITIELSWNSFLQEL